MNQLSANPARPRLSERDLYAIGFGLFLGLAILKFGNPVILDHKIVPPTSLSEAWSSPWPGQWGNWLLAVLVMVGAWLAIKTKQCWPRWPWFWVPPVVWFGWQLISATQTVDGALTATTVWHFAGCVACYFLGALALGSERSFRWLLFGVLAAFTICLVRAASQRLFEFPQDRLLLLEGQRVGWTNFPVQTVEQMRGEGLILSSNGMEVVNPAILAKLTKGRVHGTLVYPNALAGIILLLFPLALAVAFDQTRSFRLVTRWSVIPMTLFLGGAGLFWTGSKSGWLVALTLGSACVLRLNWSKRWKWTVLVTALVTGIAVFAVRFHGYFAAGATSIGARFDYWRVAAKLAREHPWLGTGPGTFQRPYSELKAPAAEMARLVHNDYLEQFSDSGIVGGIAYAVWIGLSLAQLWQLVWRRHNPLLFAVFIGLLGWFLQGVSEFGLYVPALAWVAFTCLGWLSGCKLKSNRHQI